MKKLLGVLLLISGVTFATQHHVIPSGGLTSGTASDSATGWTLAYLAAINNTTLAGDTVILHGTFSLSASVNFYPSGTAGNLLVVKACPTCGAKLTKSNAGNLLEWYSSYCELFGIEVTFTLASPVDDYGTGIYCRGNGSKIVNCIIHDCVGTGIADQSEANGTEISGCVIYYNGRRSGGNHGYGVYGQNANAPGGTLSRKVYRDNIVWSNFGDYSFHLYGESAAIDSFWLYRNILFTTVDSKTLLLLDGGLDNIIDTTYYYGYRDPSWLYLGGLIEYTPGTRPLYRGNYWMRGTLDLGSATTGRVYANNYNYGRSPVYDGGTSYVDTSDYSGSGNWWSIANWPAEATKPTGTVVGVIKNSHVSTRANIVVYNWDSSATVKAKVTSVFANGDTLNVRDAQRYFGSPVTAVVTDDSITLTMTNTVIETPIDNPLGTTSTHTDRKFNVFVVDKAGAADAGPPATPSVVASGSLSTFQAAKNANSAEQAFTVSGDALVADLVVTAPTLWQVSKTSGSGFASSISFTPSAGTVASSTVYCIYQPVAYGTNSGNISCTSTGATTQNVSVSGTATPPRVLLKR